MKMAKNYRPAGGHNLHDYIIIHCNLRYMSVGNSEYNISMNIEYTPLPPFSLNYAVPFPINNKG